MGKYEEALERAKQGLPIDEVFPELRESEDERIRKAIITYLKNDANGVMQVTPRTGEFDSWVSWLEKQKEQKPAEWSEEDEERLNSIIESYKDLLKDYKACHDVDYIPYNSNTVIRNVVDDVNFLESLRPQPKEVRDPMEIKYGGKVYQVYAVRSLPGGVTGYIIEDEPGHYDCIINPEEVLGGGYGVKQNGSPYPTKEVSFESPHWKPSEEQMEWLESAVRHSTDKPAIHGTIISLYEALKRL